LVHKGYEVLESVVVAMDPVLVGFAGVLVELVFDRERHVLTETALGSSNRLLRSRGRPTRSSSRSWGIRCLRLDGSAIDLHNGVRTSRGGR
jgi:hypothetical protein